MSRAIPTVIASARKKTPVTPVINISGRKTTIGVIVEPTSGLLISEMALRIAGPALARIPVHDDVFYHHDGIVDHEPDRRRESAERHQIEALAEML